MTNEDIESISKIEKLSRLEPIVSKFKIGQEVNIKSGSFKGNIAKDLLTSFKKRVGILLHILGSFRRVDILQRSLHFKIFLLFIHEIMFNC